MFSCSVIRVLISVNRIQAGCLSRGEVGSNCFGGLAPEGEIGKAMERNRRGFIEKEPLFKSGSLYCYLINPLSNFSFTLINISFVMLVRSYFGAQPHSSRAQVSSMLFGQLSAMACFTGSIW